MAILLHILGWTIVLVPFHTSSFCLNNRTFRQFRQRENLHRHSNQTSWLLMREKYERLTVVFALFPAVGIKSWMFCHENFLIIEKSSFPLLCSITHATRRRDQNFLRQLIVIMYTLCHPETHTSKRQISYQMLISIFLPLLFSFPTNENKYIFVSCTVLFCSFFIFLFCFIPN